MQASVTTFFGCADFMHKSDKNGEWRTLDYVSGNGKNVLNRTLNKSESVRYLRLLVTQPMQSASGKDVRIYEMEVYE